VQPYVEPQTAALLARMASDFAGGPADPTIAERRSGLLTLSELYGPEPARVSRIEDRIIAAAGEIPLRIYWPELAGPNRPLVLHLHGGGWTVGDPDAYARVCRAYCAAAGAVLVDVHYRRAPEHRYPAALEDAETALAWAQANATALGADPAKIVVTGDSAGGNLAAAVCQRTRVPLALQVLVYPVLSAQANAAFASRAALGDGRFFLREFDIKRAEAEYLSDPAQGDEPGASPLVAPERALKRLPPTLILAAGLDPLRDEAEAYSARLAAAGVPTEYACVEGTIHGFVLFAGVLELGRAAIARIGARIREL
jgi:acetyl esterase